METIYSLEQLFIRLTDNADTLRNMSWSSYDRSTLQSWDQTAYYHVAQHSATYFMDHHAQHGRTTEQLTLASSLQQEYGAVHPDMLLHIPYLEILSPDGRSRFLSTVFDRREHILPQPSGSTTARSEIIQQGAVIVLGWIAGRGLSTVVQQIVEHANELDLLDKLFYQDKLRLHYMQYFIWCTLLCTFEHTVAEHTMKADVPWEWLDPLLVADFLERLADDSVPKHLARWLVQN